MNKVYAIASVENGAKDNKRSHGYIALLDVTNPQAPIPLEDLHFFRSMKNKNRLNLKRYSGEICWQFEGDSWDIYQHIVTRDETYARRLFEDWTRAAQHAIDVGMQYDPGKGEETPDPFANNCRKARNTILKIFNQEIDPAWIQYTRGSEGYHENILEGYEAV